ncbi:hypothetical protein [Amycolatopsis sp. WAC 04182]|uniref:hypothetical protein n=1 Tax=Amycolatopsis sp. WAC 04182 TaxID=2203198 RepID=UPI0018F67747|nr:hypothetical protein [Amycolatopsis sp. WAC 04182]
MHEWPALNPGDIPTPELVAAWTTLSLTPTERIPLWAAHWLIDGHDGQALRTLAGLSGTDTGEVHDVLRDALADCHTSIPDSDTAAANTAFTHLARLHTDGPVREEWIVGKVDHILAQTGYRGSVIDLPLGQLYYLVDEWGAGWGRSIPQLRAEVRHACSAQLAAHPPTAPLWSTPDGTTASRQHTARHDVS